MLLTFNGLEFCYCCHYLINLPFSVYDLSFHHILQCWEKGIPLCKELAELYERRLFDYAKLSQILQTQAKFFDNILTQLRPEPEYFRVGFYGLSFPLFVRVRCIFMLCAICNSKLKMLPTIRLFLLGSVDKFIN